MVLIHLSINYKYDIKHVDLVCNVDVYRGRSKVRTCDLLVMSQPRYHFSILLYRYFTPHDVSPVGNK